MRIKDNMAEIENYIKERCFDDKTFDQWKDNLLLKLSTEFEKSELNKLGSLLTDETSVSFDCELRDHDKIIYFYLIEKDSDGAALKVHDGTYFLIKGNVIIASGKVDAVMEH